MDLTTTFPGLNEFAGNTYQQNNVSNLKKKEKNKIIIMIMMVFCFFFFYFVLHLFFIFTYIKITQKKKKHRKAFKRRIIFMRIIRIGCKKFIIYILEDDPTLIPIGRFFIFFFFMEDKKKKKKKNLNNYPK